MRLTIGKLYKFTRGKGLSNFCLIIKKERGKYTGIVIIPIKKKTKIIVKKDIERTELSPIDPMLKKFIEEAYWKILGDHLLNEKEGE